MRRLDTGVTWYYGRWPQYTAMSGCVAMVVLGDGHPVIRVAGVLLAPVAVLGPAALQLASMFVGQKGDQPDE